VSALVEEVGRLDERRLLLRLDQGLLGHIFHSMLDSPRVRDAAEDFAGMVNKVLTYKVIPSLHV
jgi:hypothetical protein